MHRFTNLASAPGLVQAVSGRLGGVSEGHFASLNLGLGSSDRREAVLENRRRLAAALDIPSNRFIRPYQVHGVDCLVVGREEVAAGLPGSADVANRVDCLLTAEPGIYLLMTFADCVPVLLFDRVRRVVGLVHAGWRGTLAGAPRRTLATMAERFGSRPEDVLVGIGPSIGPCHYEVGPEVVEATQRAFPGREDLLAARGGGKARLDLWRANAYQLQAAGVPEANVEVAGLCTVCRNDLLFSYRAGKGKTGFHGAVIGLRA